MKSNQRLYIFIYFNILVGALPVGAQTFLMDSCLISCAPGTTTFSSNYLFSLDADLLEWNGSSWTGGWPSANILLPPPLNKEPGCRAAFTGSGTLWTTGGEKIAMRLNQPLVSGQSYSLRFTYASDGTGANGNFSPVVYSSDTTSLLNAVFIDSLPAAGYNWINNYLSFTASVSQNGHSWIFFGTNANTSSGLMGSFCDACYPPSQATGIGESALIESVYPDPFRNYFTISFRNAYLSGASVSLINPAGQLIWKETIKNNLQGSTYTLYPGTLASGIYFLLLKPKQGSIVSRKIIRE